MSANQMIAFEPLATATGSSPLVLLFPLGVATICGSMFLSSISIQATNSAKLLEIEQNFSELESERRNCKRELEDCKKERDSLKQEQNNNLKQCLADLEEARMPEQRTVIVCGADDGEIRCENSKTLTIVSANYGRTEPTAQVCSSNSATMDDTNCRLDVLNKLSQECDGKTRCAVPTRLNDFGGSSVNPCPNTYKYVEVQYTCS
ncbi:L-rhamnose-binding lectin CSL3-like [Saccostrea echinata]|uniref:L-rhamnose-binding lectin CSL3-like n=1 Tax=Saccostrea echinata TaxID=191078 RepID=UPI002A80B5D3|nr:L-rhamnose-binding lectin CSL3-like [Saccostrea echinata]